MKRIIIALCLTVLTVWGCAHPQLTRRYQSKRFMDSPASDCVTVSVFTMDTPGEKQQRMVASLNGEGQAAFIGEIGKRTSSLGDFSQALMHTGAGGKETLIDKTIFRKRLVFAVTKKEPGQGKHTLTLADRINILKVTLKSQKGVFDSWNRFETKYQTVDLGKVSRTQSVSAQLTGSIGPAAEATIPTKLEAVLRGEKKIEEEVQLKQRYIELAGIISPEKDEAKLYQEGVVGIDLTGTFLVDFVLQAPNVFSLDEKVVILGPLEKGGKPIKPDDVQLDFREIKYVKMDNITKKPKPITCQLSYDYLLRHVVTCDRQITEGYHRVQFWKGSVSATKIKLVSEDELKARVFRVYKDNDPIILKDFFEGGSYKGNLQFADYNSAIDFIRWIKENKYVTIAKYKLIYDIIDGKLLNKEDIPSLRIKPCGLNYD